MKPQVELTIRYGVWREKVKTVAVNIPEAMAEELMEGQELSDEPFSLAVAGGFGRADAYTIRERTFKMRESYSKHLARGIIDALKEAFGVHDKLDGYKLDELHPDELAHHRARGRLPGR